MHFKPVKTGNYLLLERLAIGGMAEVFRAKPAEPNGISEHVAVKRLLARNTKNKKVRRIFEYEAEVSVRLSHQNIVKIYAFENAEDSCFLAMEFVDGKNLRQFTNKVRKEAPRLPLEFGVYIINEVCKALDYAHQKEDEATGRPLKIIHGDMSPQNIMISYEGAVKMVDFGISKTKHLAPDKPRLEFVRGKVGYVSPEQVERKPVDHRSDIFSTGIVLYELVTGKRLFSSEDDVATQRQIQECVVPAPSRVNPNIPKEMDALLLKALARDPNARFQSAADFHLSLTEQLARYSSGDIQRDLSKLMNELFADELAVRRGIVPLYRRTSSLISQGEDRRTELQHRKHRHRK